MLLSRSDLPGCQLYSPAAYLEQLRRDWEIGGQAAGLFPVVFLIFMVSTRQTKEKSLLMTYKDAGIYKAEVFKLTFRRRL